MAPELSTEVTLHEAMGHMRDTILPVHQALSHPTREVRPADAAFTRWTKATRVLQAEVERLRTALRHIADTCVQDADTAQFAARVLDGSAEPPPSPRCSGCGCFSSRHISLGCVDCECTLRDG